MQRFLPWHLLLLAASILLAVALAIGGWTLGRRRSRVPAEPDKHTPAPGSAAAIQSQGAPKAVTTPDAHGSILLEPSTATLRGALTRSLIAGEEALIGWSSTHDVAVWQFRAQKPGFYNAELTYATSTAGADAELELRVDERKRLCSLRSSGGLDQFMSDKFPVAVASSGVHQLTIQPHSQPPGPWLVLRSVRLIPTKADKPASAP